jgi:hypothetical protein
VTFEISNPCPHGVHVVFIESSLDGEYIASTVHDVSPSESRTFGAVDGTLYRIEVPELRYDTTQRVGVGEDLYRVIDLPVSSCR